MRRKAAHKKKIRAHIDLAEGEVLCGIRDSGALFLAVRREKMLRLHTMQLPTMPEFEFVWFPFSLRETRRWSTYFVVIGGSPRLLC